MKAEENHKLIASSYDSGMNALWRIQTWFLDCGIIEETKLDTEFQLNY